MARTRRSFTPEYRLEASHRVIHGNQRVADVARELGLHESVLHTWVRDERLRMAAAAIGGAPDPGGGQSLSPDARAELVRLREKVARQAEDIAFLQKASAYVAAQLDRPAFRVHFLSWVACHEADQGRREHRRQGGPAGR
jgi:transposase